jgi:ATP-dependent DNA ligase
MPLDWLPIRPERVCEVQYDRFDHDRFRHPAIFVRWRLDRAPESCGFDQFEDARVQFARRPSIGR